MAAQQIITALKNAIAPADVAAFWQDHVAPLRSAEPRGKITHITPASAHAVALTIKPNKAFAGFRAGQHITVSAAINGAWVARSYSPSALASGELQITVQQVPNGRFSHWAQTQASIGDWLKLSAPYGELAWPASTAPVIMLAAGSGITPFLSLLNEPLTRPTQLQYWVKTREHACHIDQLIALAAREPLFQFNLYCTESEQAPRLHAEHVVSASTTDKSPRPELMACGPAGFIACAEAIASAQGLPLQSEAFSLPVVISDATQLVNITLARSGKVVQVIAGEPLLPALEAQGITPASGCRRGICNTCACGKASGVSENIITQARHDGDSPGLKLCINSARSDLTLNV
ncbi:ferredoxin-NADP reductase [Paraperlucidibaca baekdonensis]|uniref:Ferredoxin-NADP reductase n=1 Tax=Paraperlucidibaca baekdonensis TaxID=748120 RepID=A0A3E0H420_9GAMM|nr:iron-sulfur cluster-binding domain-containing protein [Paraperlucidibaca baekdonensis]REH37806.1 ferredoxin-NADP reductase [Paraperlucidibaca baekdonensis]